MPQSEAKRPAAERRRRGRPKSAEAEQRDQDILHAAGGTFLRFGFDGTTMDAVAEEARMSKRTLYARYADKTALFSAVLRDLIGRWLGPIDQLQIGQCGLEDTLLALARHMTAAALTPGSIGANRIIISEAQRRPEFGRLADKAGRKPTIRMIAAILRQHRAELRPLDFDIAAEQFLSLVVDSNLRLAHLGIRVGPRQVEKWIRSVVELFLVGTRAPPGNSPRSVTSSRRR